MSGRALRRTIERCAMFTVAVAVAVVLAEVVLRVQEPVFGLMERKANWATQFVGHPVWDHMPTPSATLRHGLYDEATYPEPFDYATNSLGVRYARELAVPKPAGVTRVLVMGDSFTEGYYFDDTVAAVLERRLQRAWSGRRFEVINAGCSSYSPLLHYLRLKHQLAILQPDAAIVNVDISDVYDDYWKYGTQTTYDGHGEPIYVGGPVGWRRRAVEWMKLRSFVARLASWVVQTQRRVHETAGRDTFAYHSTLAPSSPEWQREVAFMLKNLERIVEFGRRRGIAVVVTMYPHRQQLEPDERGRLWHREVEHRVEDFCHKHDVPFFSAYDGIARVFRTGEKIFWDDDLHYTPKGQRLWAGLIADYYLGLASVNRRAGSATTP